MNEISVFEAQNKQIDEAFNDLLAGKKDASVVSAAASIMNAKTRRYEVELKRAAKGNFIADLAPRWKAEHVASSSTS